MLTEDSLKMLRRSDHSGYLRRLSADQQSCSLLKDASINMHGWVKSGFFRCEKVSTEGTNVM